MWVQENLNLNHRLIDGFPFLRGEVVYCARHEFAWTAVDFLARRARLAYDYTVANSIDSEFRVVSRNSGLWGCFLPIRDYVSNSSHFRNLVKITAVAIGGLSGVRQF